MQVSVDSRDVYGAGYEFKRWAWAGTDLIVPERFLINGYLKSDARTLEAGTGGGRILRALANAGFVDLTGFDNVPSFIDAAREQDPLGKIAFSVQDARAVSYADAQFDQIIYLQQVVSFIAEEEGRRRAVAEAYRILRPGGTALFSFLCYEVRLQSMLHKFIIAYLACLRAAAGRRRSLQAMPWPLHRFSALLDRPHHVYYYRCEEAADLLTSEGFTILGVGTQKQTEEGKLCGSVVELQGMPRSGAVFFACRK